MTPRFLAVHPQFRVSDVVQTAEHYRDVLGFEILDYFGNPPVFVHVKRDGVLIQLGAAPELNEVTRGHGRSGYNAYIWVDDVDDLAREYRSSGAKIVEGPLNRPYLCRELVVEDCNGLTLCFAKDTSRQTNP